MIFKIANKSIWYKIICYKKLLQLLFLSRRTNHMPTTSLMLNVLYFIIGITGLIAGGELLVRGASRFAKDLGKFQK